MANLLIFCTVVIATFTGVSDAGTIQRPSGVPSLTQINVLIQVMQQLMQSIDLKRSLGVYTERDDLSYERAQRDIERFENEKKLYSNEREYETTTTSAGEVGIVKPNNNGKNKNNTRKRNMRTFYLRSFKKVLKKLAKLFRKTSNEIKI